MEAQLSRLHAENAALREGGGLRDELQIATDQLREALDSKAQLQIAMASQVHAHEDVARAHHARARAWPYRRAWRGGRVRACAHRHGVLLPGPAHLCNPCLYAGPPRAY